MTATSLNLTARIELRAIADALQVVSTAAERLHLRWFVVGATARDLLLLFGYGIQTTRITYDVDLAVSVSSWNDYRALSNALEHHPNVSRAEAITYRFEFPQSVTVDIVPFGDIAIDGAIEWPPAGDRRMTVLGFQEASENTIDVHLPGSVTAPVVSLPGLILLKLLAWKERHNEKRRHDGPDIREILKTYTEAGNMDRLYDDAAELLEEHDYDPVLAGAALLGVDLGRLLRPETAKVITPLLSDETDEEGNLSLATDMSREVTENLRLLQALQTGLLRAFGSRHRFDGSQHDA